MLRYARRFDAAIAQAAMTPPTSTPVQITRGAIGFMTFRSAAALSFLRVRHPLQPGVPSTVIVDSVLTMLSSPPDMCSESNSATPPDQGE